MFKRNDLLGSSLISAGAHGILLACCLAVPAQKLIPLFQAGNSALTLTALSISAPKPRNQPKLPDADESLKGSTWWIDCCP